MNAPVRIQLSRRKGWRMPAGTVKVDRSTRWGNQFVIVALDDGRFAITRWPERVRMGSQDEDSTFASTLPAARAEAVRRYDEWAKSSWGEHHRRNVREHMVARDLACWCPLDQPCHADVLLELANTPQSQSLSQGNAQ